LPELAVRPRGILKDTDIGFGEEETKKSQLVITNGKEV
jgi:hypothetical protein